VRSHSPPLPATAPPCTSPCCLSPCSPVALLLGLALMLGNGRGKILVNFVENRHCKIFFIISSQPSTVESNPCRNRINYDAAMPRTLKTGVCLRLRCLHARYCITYENTCTDSHLFSCVYIHIHMFMYICIYIYTHIYIYIYTCHIYICVYIYTYMYVITYTCLYSGDGCHRISSITYMVLQ